MSEIAIITLENTGSVSYFDEQILEGKKEKNPFT